MTEVSSLEQMQRLISTERFILFYLSRTECGVCGAVKPKLEKVFAEGKEAIREARNFSVDEIDSKLSRLNSLLF